MKTPTSDFSDRLLELDPPAPVDRTKFDEAARQLFERRLTAKDWFWMIVTGVGGLAGGVVCGLLAATEPAGTPTRTRVALAALAGVGLFWAAFSASVIRRGTINSALHGAIAGKLGFTFSLLSAVFIGAMSLAGFGGSPATGLAILAVIPLVLAAVVVIGREIRQAELRTQQRLLEIEYRVARLAAGDVLQRERRDVAPSSTNS
jgi:hypothetical protein